MPRKKLWTFYKVFPANKKQEAAIELACKTLKVPFEKGKEESPYNPEFVKMIKKGEADLKADRYTIIKTEDLWK